MNDLPPRMVTRRGESKIISRRGGIGPFRIVVLSPQSERPCHEGCKYRFERGRAGQARTPERPWRPPMGDL
jgi:hypothetical protein